MTALDADGHTGYQARTRRAGIFAENSGNHYVLMEGFNPKTI